MASASRALDGLDVMSTGKRQRRRPPHQRGRLRTRGRPCADELERAPVCRVRLLAPVLVAKSLSSDDLSLGRRLHFAVARERSGGSSRMDLRIASGEVKLGARKQVLRVRPRDAPFARMVERSHDEVLRLLEAELRHCRLSRAYVVLDSPGRPSQRGSNREVLCELGQDAVDCVRVDVLQCLTDPQMKLSPSERGHPVV